MGIPWSFKKDKSLKHPTTPRAIHRWRLSNNILLVLAQLVALVLFIYALPVSRSLLLSSYYSKIGDGIDEEPETVELPDIQGFPTLRRPFLFLHNRKCGGSSFRKMVRKAATSVDAASFVGCSAGDSCEVYSLNQLPSLRRNNLTVIAGHFSWDSYEKLTRNRRGPPACFTILREPVSMFESYYYQRALPWLHRNVSLHTISASELQEMLRIEKSVGRERQHVGDGLTDVIGWKELGGPADSATKMLSAGPISGHAQGLWKKPSSQFKYEQWREHRSFSLPQAKENLRKCVVGILEEWEDTLAVIEVWFPWIWNNTGRKVRTRVVNKRRSKFLDPPSGVPLPTPVRRVIEEAMAHDIELYGYARKIFKEQLGAINKERPRSTTEDGES